MREEMCDCSEGEWRLSKDGLKGKVDTLERRVGKKCLNVDFGNEELLKSYWAGPYQMMDLWT